MKNPLAPLVASALLAAAGPALAEEPAPAKSPEGAAKAGLNLRLEDAVPARPRIMFGPRDAAAEKAPSSSLPVLGGPATRPFDRPAASESGAGSRGGASPFPKDTNPGR